MEGPVSRRCQEVRLRHGDLPDAPSIRRSIQNVSLGHERPMREMHRKLRTQVIIFADESYIDYINLLRQTGYQLADVGSFNQPLIREKCTSHQERGDDKRSKPRDKKIRDKAQGPRNSKPQYSSSSAGSKPFQSEYAIKHKDIPQTLTDKRKLLR